MWRNLAFPLKNNVYWATRTMNPPLPKAAEKRGDTVPKEAFVDGTPKMVDMPASKEERIAQAKRIEEVTKNGVKIRPTPGTFTYLSPEYRRERAQSALDTYHQALNSVITEDPDSPNAQIATIVKNDLDTHFKKQVANLQRALDRTKSAEADRMATQREIYSGKRTDSLFVGKEIKRPDIETMVTKSLSKIVEEGESEETDTVKEAKADFVSALENELTQITPVQVHTSNTSPAEKNTKDTATTPDTSLGGALVDAIEKTKAEGGDLGVIQTPTNPDLNEQGFYKKSEHILRPESRKDLPYLPDMEPGQEVLLQNADTGEVDTWTIESLENGRVHLKRIINGKEEVRTYGAGNIKDIMRLNAYYENALSPKTAEVEVVQEEPQQNTRTILRAQWRKKQNLGKGNFIKPTEHIQRPETAEDLPDIGVIKPGQVITLQDKESLEIAKWTVTKTENGIAFIEREKEGGEKEEQNLSIDSLREILKTNLYYKNALRAEEEQKTVTEPKKEPKAEEKPAQEQKEGKQGLKVGDTISLLNKTKTAPHNWIIESISQDKDMIRVYLKSKDGAHSLRLTLEEALAGIEATNEWKANPDNKKEFFSNPPVGELIKIFNENRKDRRALYELYVEWDSKYIASGLIDQMREKNGNLAVSVEQIESTKKLLQAYKKILELDGNENYIPGIRVETELEGNIVTLAKILSGKTTTKSKEDRNNIETLVSGYSAAGDAYQLERLEKAIQEAEPFTTQQNQEKQAEESKKPEAAPEMGPDGMPSAFEAVYEKLAETQEWAQKEVDRLKKDLQELSLTHSHYAVKIIRANIIKRDLLNVVEQLHRRMEDYVSYAETYEDFFRESANGTFAIDDDKRVKSVRFIQTLSGTQKLIDEIPLVTEQVFKAIDEHLQKPDINAIQAPPTFTYTHTKQPGGNQSPRQEPPSQEDLERAGAVANNIEQGVRKKWGVLGTTIGTVAVTAAVMLGVFGFKNKQEKEVSAAATPPVATKTAADPSKVTQWNHPEWFQNVSESKEKDIARMIGRTNSKEYLQPFIMGPKTQDKTTTNTQTYDTIFNTLALKANVPYAAYCDTERAVVPETYAQVDNVPYDFRNNLCGAIKALIKAQDSVGLGVQPELPKVEPKKDESFKEYFERVQAAITLQLQKKDSPYQV